MGVNFPYTDEGNQLYESIRMTAEAEERSNSWIVYRLLKDHFDTKSQDFQDKVKQSLNGSVEAEPTTVSEPIKQSEPAADPDFNLHD